MYTIRDLYREIERIEQQIEEEINPKRIELLKKNLESLREALLYETGAKKDENEKSIECPACGQKLTISISLSLDKEECDV